ncbi:hypothetical protein ElyMa_003822800 [Elysia marginata]|uniref:C-type lectin domain-containing protein n=1 Tax=Elysia marginata TaxID=1093978 RepID=A0AAV4FFE4_9GAST|nr:hypothetical protein ElyMa_003822800 [Elysia marginata]
MERDTEIPDESWERQEENRRWVGEWVSGRSLFPFMIQDTACTPYSACSPAWVQWPGKGSWERGERACAATQRTVTGANWGSSLDLEL